jgi:GDSL-like Lipase/Acylhydrolase family
VVTYYLSQEAKIRVILSLTGAAVGLLLIGAVYVVRPQLFARLSVGSGSSFENLEDLRSSISHRTEDDRATDREVALRGIVVPNPSDKIIYELEPNRTAKFRGQIVTMNSFGMRSPEISREKPNGVKRVAVLGDSYAFGWGVEQERVFSRWMEKDLNAGAPSGQRAEVLNFGVPGYATFQEVAAFYEKGASFNPDVVVVYFIKNDFGLPFFIKDINNSDKLLPAPEFDHQQIADDDEVNLAKRQEMFKALDANRALTDLATYCRDHGIAFFLILHPDESAPKMRKRLWVLRNKPWKQLIRHLDIADSYQAMIQEAHIPQESLSIPRDHHPGPGAHEAIGKVLAREISPVLWAHNPTPTH